MVVPKIGVILSQIFKPDGQIAEPNKTKSSMNDLAKMRADFEKKIKLAEKENFFEQKYGVNFYVFDLQTEPDKIRVHVSENYATERAIRKVQKFERETGEKLSALPYYLTLERYISEIVNDPKL